MFGISCDMYEMPGPISSDLFFLFPPNLFLKKVIMLFDTVLFSALRVLQCWILMKSRQRLHEI